VADYGALSCQDTMNLMRGRTLKYATSPAITYTRCCCTKQVFYGTISASLFSWKQTKRFEELSSTYSVAVEELKDFKKKLLLHNTEERYKEIIYDTEKSISREHKLWVSKIRD
jgi:hypothetical protein